MTQNNDKALNWSVSVEVNAETILTISSQHLSGISNIEDYKEIVLNCANHLASFIGEPSSPISQNEQQEAVAYTDGEGDFITKEMYDEYLKLGFYTECIVPLYNSPPKQAIPEGWKLVPIEPTDEMWKAGIDMADYEGFAPPYLTYEAMLNAAPTTSLTSETNTEVRE